MQPHLSASTSSSPAPALAGVDRLFHVGGMLTFGLLAVTVTMGLAGVEAWRYVFTAAHVAALVALGPLGVALVWHGFRQAALAGDPGPAGVVRRYRRTVVVLVVILIAVAASLANFEDGNRTVRRVANYTTVVAALILVVRYLLWRREAID